jgi:hypothetical protein
MVFQFYVLCILQDVQNYLDNIIIIIMKIIIIFHSLLLKFIIFHKAVNFSLSFIIGIMWRSYEMGSF